MDWQINVGRIERTVRVLLGVPIAFSFFLIRHFSVPVSVIVLLLGIGLIATAWLGHCPVHRMLGTSTAGTTPS